MQRRWRRRRRRSDRDVRMRGGAARRGAVRIVARWTGEQSRFTFATPGERSHGKHRLRAAREGRNTSQTQLDWFIITSPPRLLARGWSRDTRGVTSL